MDFSLAGDNTDKRQSVMLEFIHKLAQMQAWTLTLLLSDYL